MRRTRAITVLGLLLLAKGLVLLVAFGALLASAIAGDTLLPEIGQVLPDMANRDLGESTAFLVIGLFLLVGSIGVLRLRGWGWLLAMIGQGIDLMLGLVAYVRGDPSYVQMLADVLLVLYLNQRDVYVVLANARRRDGALQVGGEESVVPVEVEKETALPG